MENWNRIFFKQAGYKASLFYAIFGNFDVDFNISREKYRTEGIPEGVELLHYNKAMHQDIFHRFLNGSIWEGLKRSDPELANQIEHSTECYVLRGEVQDSDNLDYLRNTIGITAYFLDHGGIAVYDPQMIVFWNKFEWMGKIFNCDGAVPRNHTIILYSEENDGTKWYHTRGMRKFGRPDISIHYVPSDKETATINLLNRFVELLAFGGHIPDRQKIKIVDLPETMWCENKGSFDDPDFNNKHVEIHWE